jgi:hypothetical protein
MEEQHIPLDWIEETMQDPDGTDYDMDDHKLYNKSIAWEGAIYPIRVVVDENFLVIITVFFTD